MDDAELTREIAPLCMSRGPRIGNQGCPYCKLPSGHDGNHRPAPKDGWGEGMYWGEPW